LGNRRWRKRPWRAAYAGKWVLQIRKACRAADTAFFFKQWGGVNKKAAGRLLRGKTYDEMPSS